MRTRDGSRAAKAYWFVVLAVAIALGVAAPQFFLLGFWEMAPIVFVASWLAPKVLGHR
jgi:hypothetical protein